MAMDKTLDTMTKQELLVKLQEDEMRMAELDPEDQRNPPVKESGIAHRDSSHLNEYQNLKAESQPSMHF